MVELLEDISLNNHKTDDLVNGRPGDRAGYAIIRELAQANRGDGWCVNLRRRGRLIRRTFKDSIYGSEQASLAEAVAFRDAIISALPPRTNHEQAVLLKSTNNSGISGVRKTEFRGQEVWQVTLLTNDGQNKAQFSIRKYGDARAREMAIRTRRAWLEKLPVKHLTYAEYSSEVTQSVFGDQLQPVEDVLPEVNISEEEVTAILKAIETDFDARKPRRLKIRVSQYDQPRITLYVSDGKTPAKKKQKFISTARLTSEEIMLELQTTIVTFITELYDEAVAQWFIKHHWFGRFTAEKVSSKTGINFVLHLPRSTSL
ncbi:hypothetical protein [Oryzifoliimicrobium ureilyticus]|uniref:hypothetical protein n=1 Tax=Oryzifoliimicrobium ureilyticus TaxID=3113724 RepID=UPI0030766141